MTSKLQKRGRPKGTGLDDSAHLRAIAELIHQSKDLKPTTAIRSLGISDPSTIRRLRDKYNSARTELNAAIKAAEQLVNENETNILQADFSTEEITDTQGPDDASPIASNVIPLKPPARDTSAQSCALSASGEEKLTERKKKKPAKKKIVTKKKPKSKTNKTATKKQKPETKATRRSSKKSARKAANNSAGQEQQNPFNTWLTMSAQIMAATAQTQLQMLKIAQSSLLYKEIRDAQSQAIDAWLHAITPVIGIDNNTHTNSPIPEASAYRDGK